MTGLGRLFMDLATIVAGRFAGAGEGVGRLLGMFGMISARRSPCGHHRA